MTPERMQQIEALEEKTAYLIDAAKAVGWTNLRIYSGELRGDGPVSGRKMIYPPNPFVSDADCNALLVATLGDGSKPTDWRVHWLDRKYCCLYRFEGALQAEGESNNPDKHSAYREAVTRACVEAWRAEQGEKEG